MKEISAKFANMSLLCALMVVGIHIGTHCAEGSAAYYAIEFLGGNGILRLAVPFFFLASGYWLANSYENGRPYKVQLAKRVSTLLVPYVLFNLLWVVFTFVTTRELQIHSVSSAIRALGLNPMERPAMGFLWFVRFLMILVVVSPLLYRLARCKISKVLLPVFFVVAGVIFMFSVSNKEWFLFFEYGFCVEGLFCFFAGMVFRCYPVVITRRRWFDYSILVLGFVLFAVRIVCVAHQCLYVAYWASWFGVVSLMYGLWCIMPTRKLPEWIVSCSFPVYLVHPFIVMLMAGAVKMLGFRDLVLTSFVFFLVRWMAVFVMCVILVNVLRKISPPPVYAVLFGGR